MSLVSLLSRCALYQVVGESTEVLLRHLGERVTDKSRILVHALHQANDRAWKAIEVTLAGETLWNRLDAADEKAFRRQLRNLLDNMRLPILTRRAEFRKLCHAELNAARRDGHLLATPSTEQLSRSLADFGSHVDQVALLERQRNAVREMARYLQRHHFENLAHLVAYEVQPGEGLLVLAVQYFFRRAIESDEELRESLQFTYLENLTASQEVGFRQLDELLRSHGPRMEALLGGLETLTRETHDAVLDVHAEQARHGGQLGDIYQMLRELLALVRQQDREPRPGAACTIRSPRDRQRVRELVHHYRRLPETTRRQRPALLNSVAMLQAAAGDTHAARRDFEEVALLVQHDPAARAEVRHNAYLAALEQRDYPAALAAVREAVALDPARYAPFPFEEYLPEEILGAGGFGVVFRCRHVTLDRPLVIKALALDATDGEVVDLFREARALNDLDHPAVIHLRDCRFADAARRRPYLVLDYFDSPNLKEHVERHGPLAPAELLPVARAVAEAMREAHACGLLHRDIKPDNLLVRRDPDGTWKVKLIDFGLVLERDAADATLRPEDEDAVAGTIDYAAPEQMGRQPGVPVGPWSDVYAFARTCYFALLGTPEPDDTERETLDEGWRKLLSRCTARKVEGRIKDFSEVLDLLRRIEKPSAASMPAAPPPPEPVVVKVDIPVLAPVAPLPLVIPEAVPEPAEMPRVILPDLWLEVVGATVVEDSSHEEVRAGGDSRCPVGAAFGEV